ncbi:MAG: CidA/LrgA family protein [Agathobacter sp.]|nr:CidA/LrgA family protein [Agathobacter sp.]
MKRVKRFIVSFAIIFAISLIGELLHAYIPLPIPASVYGVLLLFLALAGKVIPLEWVESGADLLIFIMPLLFVPSVVKLVTLKSLILDNLIPLLLIIVISSVVVMVVTGKVSQWMIERKDDDDV